MVLILLICSISVSAVAQPVLTIQNSEGAKETELWFRIELEPVDPNRIIRNGEPWPMDVGYPLYDFALSAEILPEQRRSFRIHTVPAALVDTFVMAAVVSDAPDNDVLVLAGREDTRAPWRIYIDRNNDNRFAEDEYLFTAESDNDNGGRPHKAARGAMSVLYDDLKAGQVVRREFPVEVIWVQNNAGVASTRRYGGPLFLFNAETMLLEGRLITEDTTFTFAVRKIRDGYFPDVGFYHEVLVDLDGNGSYDVSNGSAEFFDHREPFPLGHRMWEVAEVDADGEWVQLQPVGNSEARQSAREISSRRGETAPAWRGTTLRGDALQSTALVGRYVLLDFWASWCSPCIQEIPNLRGVVERYSREDIAVVGIATRDSEDGIRAAASTYGITWPVVLDLLGETASAFNVRGLPDPILVGPDGSILERGGALRGEGLDAVLRKYLREE